MANEKKEKFALNDNKQSYIICTIHVKNNGHPNTLITVHREVKRNQKKLYMFFISFPSFQLVDYLERLPQRLFNFQHSNVKFTSVHDMGAIHVAIETLKIHCFCVRVWVNYPYMYS